jgi:hypothetical protein
MRASTSSRTLTIAILLVFAVVALGQLKKERPAQAATSQHQNASSSSDPATNTTSQATHKDSRTAQSTNSPGTQNPNDATANNLTIRGCLMQGKQGYTLQQEATDTTFQLMGDSGKFDGYTGKTVEVRGREMEPQAQSMNMPRFRVDALKVVSDQCTVTPRAASPNSAAPSAERNIEPDATPRYERPNPVQSPPAVPVNPNTQGITGAPSAGTGNPPPQPQKPPTF